MSSARVPARGPETLDELLALVCELQARRAPRERITLDRALLFALEHAPAYVPLLLHHGADPNATTPALTTPLMAALCPPADHAVAEALLAYGADVDGCDAGGLCALHRQAREAQVDFEAVELLRRYGADDGVRNYKGHTPYDDALMAGHAGQALAVFDAPRRGEVHRLQWNVSLAGLVA